MLTAMAGDDHILIASVRGHPLVVSAARTVWTDADGRHDTVHRGVGWHRMLSGV